MERTEVIIIGAGLAGLNCARRLMESGVTVAVLEADTEIGGRVRTEVTADGFRIDRGFQVLLTAYPEAARVLDYDRLKLRPLRSAAMVRVGSAWHTVASPWHEPLTALRGLRNPVGTPWDKIKAGLLSLRLNAGSPAALTKRRETTALARLERTFSPAMIERFFRPFFGGVLLDPQLEAGSRWFEWLYRMFGSGGTAVPALGMGEIPRQLADSLPPGTVRTGAAVESISGDGTRVRLRGGLELRARAVVVATDSAAAGHLLPMDVPPTPCREARSWWFTAVAPSHATPVLYLNGNGAGPVNNAIWMSNVSRDYAPPGRALLNVTTLPGRAGWDREIDVRMQLRDWFGPITDDWRLLREQRVAHALPVPAQLSPRFEGRPPRVRPGVFLCGDHHATASINGALLSGRRAAEAVLEEFAATPLADDLL